MTLPFLYQLQKASYQTLSSKNFRIGVVDLDDANLSKSQVTSLTHNQDKIVLTYLSIGEAEDYRSYWTEGKWTQSKPGFLLGENPDWPGNYSVKFWDADWQDIMFSRVDEAVKLGYSGMYLDIVDAYEVAKVRKAYPGTNDQLRQEMIGFVTALSQHAKAQNPGFLVVPQNAVRLLALNENNPGGASNAAYLNAIDGLGVEDLWYDGNSTAGWTAGDLELIDHALGADKFVLATSYPTQDAKQETFINKAIAAGLIPFAADRDLTGVVDAINDSAEAKLAGKDVNFPMPGGGASGGSGGAGSQGGTTVPDVVLVGTSQKDTLTGGSGDDTLSGKAGADVLKGGGGGDTLLGGAGNDVLKGGSGNDTLSGDGGNDMLWGNTGHDRLQGGTGNDRLSGGNGNDRVAGNGGNDILTGDAGKDRLWGGSGNDTLSGDGGNDMLWGNTGHDRLQGGTGNDRLSGGNGNDRVAGNGGNDILTGDAGKDRLWGGSGNDTLSGDGGNDMLWGNTGHDRLQGGTGNDRLSGGNGNDRVSRQRRQRHPHGRRW